MYSDIFSGVLRSIWHSGILAFLLACILTFHPAFCLAFSCRHMFWYYIRHSFWHDFWLRHSIWHMLWLSIWYFVWHIYIYSDIQSSILVSVVSVRVHACPTASGARDMLRIHAGPAASGARDRVRFHMRPAASGACEKVRVRAGQLQPELAIWLGSVRAQIQLELAMSSWHSTHKLADKYSKDEEWRREEDKKRKREAEKKRGGVAFLLKTRDPYLVGGGKNLPGGPTLWCRLGRYRYLFKLQAASLKMYRQGCRAGRVQRLIQEGPRLR